MMRRHSAGAAALAVVALLVGCGSTVPTSVAPGTNDATGSAAGAAPLSPGAVRDPRSPGAAPTPDLPGGSTGDAPGGVSGDAVVRAGTNGRGASRTVAGVTATTIAVGLPYHANADAANRSLGVPISQGDELAVWKALVADVNARGGILGRRLAPVYHAYDGTSAETADSQMEAACADYTQDHKVFAVADGGDSDTLLACLHRAGVVSFQDNFASIFGGSDFSRYPGYVVPSALNVDRVAAIQADSLVAQQYFAPKSTVGIVIADLPSINRALDRVLLPALAGHGVRPKEIARIPVPRTTAEIANYDAAISSAVLRFNSQGVDHAIILDTAGAATMFFVQHARSQNYHPRYGINTSNGVQVLMDSGIVPPEEMVGAVGFGWIPVLDLPRANNSLTSPTSNAARRTCHATLRRAGITFADANAEKAALQSCNGITLLKAALESGGGVTRAAYLDGVGRLGTRFMSGLTLGTDLRPGRHDGVAAYRYLRYDSSCTCMQYAGPTRRAG